MSGQKNSVRDWDQNRDQDRDYDRQDNRTRIGYKSRSRNYARIVPRLEFEEKTIFYETFNISFNFVASDR